MEYRAYAVDINGSVSYAPHGLYYVDKGWGSRVLIVDPWVMIWTLTRVALDYRPVVAVDLPRGERQISGWSNMHFSRFLKKFKPAFTKLQFFITDKQVAV